MAQFTWQSWGFSSVEMSTATRSKHVFVALCMTQLECRRHGQEGEPKQRIFADVSNDVLGMSRLTSTITAGMSEARSLRCFLQFAWDRSFRFPLWQTMCASGLSETNRERKRRGFRGPLSELLGSSASAYAKAHRPASSNSAPRLALVTSHRSAAIDARIEHRRGPRLEDLRFWQRRVPRPVTNVHDSGV